MLYVLMLDNDVFKVEIVWTNGFGASWVIPRSSLMNYQPTILTDLNRLCKS